MLSELVKKLIDFQWHFDSQLYNVTLCFIYKIRLFITTELEQLGSIIFYILKVYFLINFNPIVHTPSQSKYPC